jgi:hypothetical protein
MYPEYLMQRRRPPPLVTSNLLVGTVYAVAGAVAGMYGLSKYVLDPMHDSLTEARRELLAHAATHLDEFNARLKKLAPAGSPGARAAGKGVDESEDGESADGESEEEDGEPTELFHRDVGVQTSPPPSRNHSAWSLSDAATDAQQPSSPAGADALSQQESRLKSLATHVRDLEQSAAASSARQKQLADQIAALDEFLAAIALPAAHARYKMPQHATWSSLANRPPVGDELDRFRAEVSRTKGLMLSTRNFPRGTS